MEQLLNPDFDVEELGLNFDCSGGFGPASAEFNFKDQFDGKLFKPYNRKERLGKMFDFSTNYQQNNFGFPNQNVKQPT